MIHKGNWIVDLVLLILVAGLTYAGWRVYSSQTEDMCAICRRPLHAQTKAAGRVEGQKGLYCCPTCALTAHHQTGKPVTITRLSDFNTSAPLSPENTFVVEGSDVNLCSRSSGVMDQHKHGSSVEFDRCNPSIIAFSNEQSAETFAETHGGRVLPFQQLAATYKH